MTVFQTPERNEYELIRMIVSDLDGTLLAGKSHLPEENMRALQRAMDAGVRVSIASGRMLEATLPIARKIGVNAPISLFNGAMTYDLAQNRVLHGVTIPRETAVRVLRAVEARGAYVQAFPGEGYYMEEKNEWTAYYENKIGVIGTAVGRRLSDWLETDVYKLLCLGSSAELSALLEALTPQFPEICFVKSGETHLEIVARGVSKASGLQALSECTGISTQEMLTFGDEMNDLPMLKLAGTAYAMENCVDGVKKEIRRIAPANTSCGVARVVNLYLDEGKMGRG